MKPGSTDRCKSRFTPGDATLPTTYRCRLRTGHVREHQAPRALATLRWTDLEKGPQVCGDTEPTQYDLDVRPWPPIGKPTRIVVSGEPEAERVWRKALEMPGFKEGLDAGIADLAAGRVRPFHELVAEMAATAGEDEPEPSRWDRIRAAFPRWRW